MIFSSTLFLCMFLPVSLLGYYARRDDHKNYWLLIASLLFFAWSGPGHLWAVLLLVLINYSCVLLFDRFGGMRRLILFAALAADLAVLFYFKYISAVPAGMSFLVFGGMSYVIDVYRKDAAAQKDPLKVGLYLAMFPKLIAGPVVRYKDIAQELGSREITRDDLGAGIERFIAGLAKKVILADTLAVAVDAIWANGASGNTWSIAWAGSIAYTLQIFFDFSGYSDMAIGLGRMLGFHFPENFDLPYISRSITEFWRRWHMSLSAWFRDYVYNPLGGSRKHVYRNLSVVFLLTGLWHGASWHFIVWGLWHGTFILIERAVRLRSSRNRGTGILSTGNRSTGMHSTGNCSTGILSTGLARLYTLLVVHFGWVLFRAPSLKEAAGYIGTMFGCIVPEKTGFSLFWYFDRWTITAMILALFFSSSAPARAAAFIRAHVPENVIILFRYAALLLLLFLSMIRIVSGTYQPFIYFQF